MKTERLHNKNETQMINSNLTISESGKNRKY